MARDKQQKKPRTKVATKHEKVKELLILAKEFKASKLEVGDIKIEMSKEAFIEKLTPAEIKEIMEANKKTQEQEDEENLYHSVR